MIGNQLAHYRILDELGRGGMGVVYKAEDTKLDRTVAIKVLPPDMTRDAVAKKRFIHEAKAASALDHANICTVHAIDETEDGLLYIVMAYYEGSSLADLMESSALDLETSLDLMIQACRGLERAHRNDIVHRDIKPANMMVTAEGDLKIVDFGLAKVANQTQITQEGSTIGTAAYMSPEQARGEMIDARTDQWSIGAVMYEMLTGKRAFGGEYSQAIIYSLLNEEPASLLSLNPDLPTGLVAVVERMLSKDADDRFKSLAEVARELQMLLDKERGIEPSALDLGRLLRSLRSPKLIAAAAVILSIVGYVVAVTIKNQAEVRYAQEVLIPRLDSLMSLEWSDYSGVFDVIQEGLTILPNDPRLLGAQATATRESSFLTSPEGADVYIKPYNQPDKEWQHLGASPVENVRIPIGIFRVRFEKEGFQTVEAAATSWTVNPMADDLIIGKTIHRTLDSLGASPEGMVRVQGIERPDGVVIDDFFIDKTEVTNEEFLAFIQAGGYRNAELWKHPFVLEGDTMDWDAAMKLMVDQTGRPGPSSWSGGSYPDGEADFPAAGISWYEADAYAQWVGKSLPTSAHWGRARGEYTDLIRWPQLGGFAALAPFSNFASDGPVAVASLPGYTAFGAYDMAGNVREWMLNPTGVGRMVRGGAWSDNTYAFTEPAQLPEFNRIPKNGFRLALYAENSQISGEILKHTFLAEPPDFEKVEPVSDEVFEQYEQQYEYEPYDLDIVRESSKAGDGWVLERYSYENPYDDERIVGNLFLPTNTEPPYQVVVYFPGSASMLQTSSVDIDEYYEYPLFLEWLVKNGRAVLYPTYEGTFERHDPAKLPFLKGDKSYAFSTHVRHVVLDFMASLDFLETRDDIDMEHVAYFGMSWGARYGAIIPAVDIRIEAIVLIPPIIFDVGLPEVHQVNYQGRITQPILALAGEYDTLQDPTVHITPAFRLFGTPDEHKKLKYFKTDHIPPKNDMIREVLTWLDEYMGPVDWR